MPGEVCRSVRPAAVPPLGAFADEVAFHLRSHGGDHEQHLVGDGGPVQPGAGAGGDVQVDLTGVQLVLQQHEEFFHRAGDPVGLVDHQGVAGLEHGEGLAQLGPIGAGAGGLDDDVAAVCGGQRVQL